jgi:hypothetical protein
MAFTTRTGSYGKQSHPVHGEVREHQRDAVRRAPRGDPRRRAARAVPRGLRLFSRRRERGAAERDAERDEIVLRAVRANVGVELKGVSGS